jgi:hypothetical protein
MCGNIVLVHTCDEYSILAIKLGVTSPPLCRVLLRHVLLALSHAQLLARTSSMRCCCLSHSSHCVSSHSCSPPLYAATHAQPLVPTSFVCVMLCVEHLTHGSSLCASPHCMSSRSHPPPLCVSCRALLLCAPLGSSCIQTLTPISYMHAPSHTADVLCPAKSLSSPHACYHCRPKKPLTNS